MIQALPERISFAEFLEWYPENGRRYELHNGIVEDTCVGGQCPT
jgi:Uma2 family endonuclease